jgi:hypothetical protein
MLNNYSTDMVSGGDVFVAHESVHYAVFACICRLEMEHDTLAKTSADKTVHKHNADLLSDCLTC